MQQIDSENHTRYSDEIDLVDIWLILMRYKWLLIGITLLCIVLSSIYAAVRVPVYEYVNTLEIGGYWSQSGENPSAFAGRFIEFEDATAVVAKIKSSYGPVARQQAIQQYGKDKVPNEVSADAEKNSSSVAIKVRVPEINADIAKQLLATVSEKIIQDHGALLENRRDLLAGFLNERIAEISQQIENLYESRRAIVKNSSADTKALTMLLADSRLQQLEADRAQLRKELKVGLRADLRPTRIIIGPIRAIQPVGPGGLAIVLLGGIAGVILGVVAVMFQQLLESARVRSRKNHQ